MQPTSNNARVAFVFPGQGPQQPSMLEEARSRPGFDEHYRVLSELAKTDVLEAVQKEGPDYLRRNEIASMVTVFCSALEKIRLEALGHQPLFAAGYSVGQWSAMYAAGMLSYEETMRLVARRAELMNNSEATKDGAMLAVIGLETERV